MRRELLLADVGIRNVTEVSAHEIVFHPGQTSGRHIHPSPVVGYIAEGDAVLEIAGRRPQFLAEGSVFFEPADTVILRFDNASPVASMKFIAFYLLDGQQELIVMLSATQ